MGLRSIMYPAHALARWVRIHRPRRHPEWDPLRHLPSELVSAIFQQWLQDQLDELDQHSNPSQLPVLLSLVSKSWRDFVYTNPFLWQFVKINASENKLCRLAVLENRISRTQNVPLVLHLAIGDVPHIEALRILFSQSHRFCELSLSVSNLSWWEDVSMGPFSQLKELTIEAWPVDSGYQAFTSIFSTAPLLRCADWSAPLDPSPLFGVYGDKFLSLDLLGVNLDIPSILDILAACPQLRIAMLSVIAEVDDQPLPCKIMMRNLRCFVLRAPGYLPPHLFKNIRAPFLSTFWIIWSGSGDRALLARPLESFLSHSMLIRDLFLYYVLHSEESLIRILRTHPRIRELYIRNAPGFQADLLTNEIFRLLTFREGEVERQNVLLPELEVLSIVGGLRTINGALRGVGSKEISTFIGSRRPCSPISASFRPQGYSGQAGLLRLVELVNCDRGGAIRSYVR
ncbi:hypothetical protein J3A83DRAFT_4200562 [Scleroderma citrinum]